MKSGGKSMPWPQASSLNQEQQIIRSPWKFDRIGLSDNQLEVVMRTAKPMTEEKCQEFLQRVAAILSVRGSTTFPSPCTGP
jgi:hypothetical protein